MFNRLFNKKAKAEPQLLVAQLNARIQPMHRGEFFEDPLTEKLEKIGIAEVTGGGTLQNTNGEIDYCDIEIEVKESNTENINKIIDFLNDLGAPKGSILKEIPGSSDIPFGVTEGLAVYLNGTDLPENVYAECDSNFAHSEFERLLADSGRVLSYWQGPTETAFYMYGKSFLQMKQLIQPFIESYPLCQKCRIEQVA